MVRTDRGQVFTLEAFVAALLLLSSVVFVLQVTAATPLSPSTSNQHVENQESMVASGLLDTAAAKGALRSTLLYWDANASGFHNASVKGYYLTCAFDTPFGDMLNRTFEARGTACDVNLRSVGVDGTIHSRKLVYVGDPTDNAVRVTTTITLYDDDVLLDANGNPTGTTLAESKTFYAPDVAPDGPLYNVVEVEVIVWRA